MCQMKLINQVEWTDLSGFRYIIIAKEFNVGIVFLSELILAENHKGKPCSVPPVYFSFSPLLINAHGMSEDVG